MVKAEVIEVYESNVDIRIKCKCGNIFTGLDKDFNDFVVCDKCEREYSISIDVKVILEEMG